MPEFTLIVLAAIVANLLTPTVKYLWRCIARFVRRHYLWHDSTQRRIGKRRHWRKAGNLRKYTHRIVAALLSNLIDIEFIEWREAINKNNARLYRKSSFTERWVRHSQANIEECLVDPSYNQFLELMMDEDIARFSAENKPWGNAFRRWAEKTQREFDEYKQECNENIELIDNKDRYESILEWGFMWKYPPHIVARIYEDKTLPFPEDYHIHVEGNRSYDFGHIYRYMEKMFPKGA